MNRSRLLTAAVFAAALADLVACSKPAPPPVAQVQAPPAAAPAKPMKMVCRNSQTGAKAECGSAGAVMVGMEPA